MGYDIEIKATLTKVTADEKKVVVQFELSSASWSAAPKLTELAGEYVELHVIPIEE
jgi:hypothetical protein